MSGAFVVHDGTRCTAPFALGLKGEAPEQKELRENNLTFKKEQDYYGKLYHPNPKIKIRIRL